MRGLCALFCFIKPKTCKTYCKTYCDKVQVTFQSNIIFQKKIELTKKRFSIMQFEASKYVFFSLISDITIMRQFDIIVFFLVLRYIFPTPLKYIFYSSLYHFHIYNFQCSLQQQDKTYWNTFQHVSTGSLTKLYYVICCLFERLFI